MPRDLFATTPAQQTGPKDLFAQPSGPVQAGPQVEQPALPPQAAPFAQPSGPVQAGPQVEQPALPPQAAPFTQPAPKVDFNMAFENYRTGQMSPEKVPAFEELLKRRMPRMFHDQPIPENVAKTFGDIAETAIKAMPGSMWETGKAIAGAITSPIDTATAIGKTAHGWYQAGLEKLPQPEESEAYKKFTANLDAKYPELQQMEDPGAKDIEYWNAFEKDMVGKYGSLDGFINAVETKPAEVMFDAAGALTLGGNALTKVPGMAKAGQVMTELGQGLDLAQTTGKLAVKGGKKLAAGGAKVVEEGLGITTGVGRETVREAKAGTRNAFNTLEDLYKRKSPENKGFDLAQQGKIEVTDIVRKARTAVEDVREQNRQSFKENLASMEDTGIPVTMDKVTNTLVDTLDNLKIKPKGVSKAGKLEFNLDRFSGAGGDTAALQKVIDRVIDHGSQADDLTPTGMLELRDYLDTITNQNPKVVKLIEDLKGSIDDGLKEIPGYDKLRTEANMYNSLIKEFENALGLDPKKTGHEVIGKLIKASGEDVGLRRNVLAQLEAMSDTSLAQEIAGIEMRGLLPKAMVTRAAGAGLLMGGMVTSTPLLAALASIASPRLMGKLLSTYGYSRNTVKSVVDALKKTGAFDQKVTTSAAIAGRAQDEENK